MKNSEESDLSKIVKNTGAALFKFAAGPIGELISGRLSRFSAERIESQFRGLNRRFERLKDRVIELDQVDEDFCDLFKSSYLVMVRSHKLSLIHI